jgi:hypothetical protein
MLIDSGFQELTHTILYRAVHLSPGLLIDHAIVLACSLVCFSLAGLSSIPLFHHSLQIVAAVPLSDPAIYHVIKG